MLANTPQAKLFLIVIAALVYNACVSSSAQNILRQKPLPNIVSEDSVLKLSDNDESVLFEIHTAKISKPINNLAIHYSSLFPEGEAIRPGDTEEYVKIDGHNAYKVTFRPAYIRQRKRLKDLPEIPQGWKTAKIEDPVTGKPLEIAYGPVIPRQKLLYLVEGNKFVYYVFMRADGDAIESARLKFDEFVRTGIDYK
jgi:hypothetical protein